jgi:DNA-binding transcriptional ArsR family regulator
LPQQVPARIDLKPAQRQALAQLSDGRLPELTRGAYQELTGMSRSQAAYDLADLVEAGILERVGGGRSTRYRLARQETRAQRRWTDERIRAELAQFCNGRATWPSATEFKAAGHADLYVAASRYGGVGFWAAELGLRAGRAAEQQETLRLRRPRRLSWATAGALVGALLVGVAVAIVQWPSGSQKPRTAQGSSPVKVVSHASHGRKRARPKAATARASIKPTVPRGRRQAPTSTAPRTELAVRTISSSVSRSVSARATPRKPTPAGPTPIPAPLPSSSAPAPLPLP